MAMLVLDWEPPEPEQIVGKAEAAMPKFGKQNIPADISEADAGKTLTEPETLLVSDVEINEPLDLARPNRIYPGKLQDLQDITSHVSDESDKEGLPTRYSSYLNSPQKVSLSRR